MENSATGTGLEAAPDIRRTGNDGSKTQTPGQGTDTELLVILESRRDASGKSEWQYAFASFTDYELPVSIDDQETWKSTDGTIAENGKLHYWDFLEQRPKPGFEP